MMSGELISVHQFRKEYTTYLVTMLVAVLILDVEYLLAGSDGIVTSSTIMGDKYNMQTIANIRDYNVVITRARKRAG